MPSSTWSFTTVGRSQLLNGSFDIDSDAWKVALFTSASNLSTSSNLYSSLTGEVANGNGYTTGGQSVALTLTGTTTVVVDITSDPVWTASGGSITARYAAIYEVGGSVLAFTTLDTTAGGTDMVATAGNQLSVQAAAGGVFTLA